MAERWTRTAINREPQFETREDNGNLYIEGYFAVFDGFYDLYGGDQERVDAHAFDNTLGGDIRALINHDTTLVLGRTTAHTLDLRVDNHGLWGSILINRDDQDAMNLYARVQRGDVSQCSFGFDILSERYEQRDDGSVLWVIEDVKLYEVSCCTFPAYEDTAIAARSAEHDDIKRRARDAWKIRAKEKLKGREVNGTESADAQAEA